MKKTILFDRGRRDLKDTYDALLAIYTFYEDFTADIPVACRSGCNTCCTASVTATSLEINYMVKMAGVFSTPGVVNRISSCLNGPVYRPVSTINQSASRCMAGREPAPEHGTHGLGKCPMLNKEGLCSVYAFRPFACRAMSSESACKKAGGAFMQSFLITINLVIYQIIEHMDRGGQYGNMLDLLIVGMKTGEGIIKGDHILTNQELPGFIIPPDELPRFKSFMRRLVRMPVGNLKLGDYLPKEPRIIS